MGARSETGNKHLLFIVDRVSKLLFVYPLPNKTAENVAKKLLELLLIFEIPLSLRSGPGTEFTVEVVQHLCKWLSVTIDYGPSDHPRAQGAVERLGGGGFMKSSWNFAKTGLGNGMKMCSQPSGYIGQHPIHACQAKPFLLLFSRDCRTQMDTTSPSPDDEGKDELHNLIADKSENLLVQKVRKDLQHCHEQRQLRRELQNAGIRRPSTGTRVKQGDLVLVKEADSALYNDYVHVNLTMIDRQDRGPSQQ